MQLQEIKKIVDPEAILFFIETLLLLLTGYVLEILKIFNIFENSIILILIAIPVFYLTHRSKPGRWFTEYMDMNILPVNKHVIFDDSWTKYYNNKISNNCGENSSGKLESDANTSIEKPLTVGISQRIKHINTIMIKLMPEQIKPLAYSNIYIPTYSICDYNNNNVKKYLIQDVSREMLIGPFATKRLRDNSDGRKAGFSIGDIDNFARKHRITLENKSSIWINGVEINSNEIRFSYIEIKYFPKFLLNWMLDYRFTPGEKETPREILVKSLCDFMNNNYSILKEIPASVAVEVLVITSDDKLVMKKRGAYNAVNRGVWENSVSGGLDLEDLNHAREDDSEAIFEYAAIREMKFELGIGDENCNSTARDILTFKKIGIAHSLSTNTFHFIYYCKVSLTFETIKNCVVNGKKPEEEWETAKIEQINMHNMDTELKEYLEKTSKVSDRFIMCLYYLNRYLKSM